MAIGACMRSELVNILFRTCVVFLLLLISGAEFYISWLRTDLYIRYLDWAFGKRRSYILNRDQNIKVYIWGLRIGSVFALAASLVVLFVPVKY